MKQILLKGSLFSTVFCLGVFVGLRLDSWVSGMYFTDSDYWYMNYPAWCKEVDPDYWYKGCDKREDES